MTAVNLTPERIRLFQCPAGKHQAFLWDAKTRLGVRVTANGARSFIWQGKVKGQTVRMTIGETRAWALPDAREEANAYQRLADKNIDPREVRRDAERQKAAAEAAHAAAEKYALKNLCAAYVRHLEAKGKPGAAKAARSLFSRFVDASDIAGKPAKDLTSAELARLIRAPREAGKERTAGVLRSYLLAAYEVAIKAPLDASLPSEMIAFAVVVNPVRAIPAIPVNAGTRTLSPDELGRYAAALGSDGPISDAPTMADAVLWAELLTGGQRIQQLLRATVDDWNADTETLRLFDGKGKRRQPREHLIPLAKAGAAFIAHMVKRAKAMDGTFIFAVTGKPVHPANVGHRLAEIRESALLQPFDIRDVRRTVETMLAGMSISRDVRAQLLSHGISGVQAVHYDKHAYTKEKRAALAKWEKHLLTLRKKHTKGAA